MLLAESPFSSQIRADVGSLRTLFVTLFFTFVGMLADPAWFLANWIEVLVWLAVVFIGMDHGLKPEVIELNPASVKAARAMGLTAHLGDASSAEILAHAGVTGSCVIVVTVPDPRSAKRILQNVHALSPASGVIVRSRYNISTMDLWELGAAFVVDEENVVGQEIARQVIEFLKDSDPETVTCALPPDAT